MRQSSTPPSSPAIQDKAVDHAWKHLQAVNDISRLADTKASAMLAAAGVTEGLILRQNLIALDDGVIHLISSMLLIVAAIALAVSAVFSMRALMPQVKVGKQESLLYFGNVERDYASATRQRFLTDYREFMQDNTYLLDGLSEQVFASSLIVMRKLYAIRRAILLLVGGVLLLGAGVMLRLLHTA